MSHLSFLKKKKNVLILLLLGSLLGFVLRLIQRHSGSSIPGTLLTLLALLVIVFAVLTARQFQPRPGFLQNHRPTPALLVQLGSAVPLIIAFLIHLFLKQEPAPIFIGLTGMIGTLCIAACTAFAIIRQRPPALLYFGIAIGMICRLIPEFRSWSVSPDFHCYTIQLFASISVLLTTLHLSGFALEDGKRRTTIALCIISVFFCIISLADGGIFSVLSALGYTMFLAGALWELLTLPRRRRNPQITP